MRPPTLRETTPGRPQQPSRHPQSDATHATFRILPQVRQRVASTSAQSGICHSDLAMPPTTPPKVGAPRGWYGRSSQVRSSTRPSWWPYRPLTCGKYGRYGRLVGAGGAPERRVVGFQRGHGGSEPLPWLQQTDVTCLFEAPASYRPSPTRQSKVAAVVSPVPKPVSGVVSPEHRDELAGFGFRQGG